MTEFQVLVIAMNLSPLAKKIILHMQKAGSISARDAFTDLDITSASLTRRITDITEAGIPIKRASKINPATGKRYTRYSIDNPPKKKTTGASS